MIVEIDRKYKMGDNGKPSELRLPHNPNEGDIP